MRSPDPEDEGAASRPDWRRLAASAAGLGIVLALLDGYWGNGQGMLALALLLAGSAAAQAVEYSRAYSLLRHPRRPDARHAAGAAYVERIRMAVVSSRSIVRQFGAAAVFAGLIALLPQARRPGFMVSGMLALAAEALVLGGLFRIAVRRGWIPPSRKPFHGKHGGRNRARRESGLGRLAATGKLARLMSRSLPAPYGWLVRRKTLDILREDPAAPLLLAVLVLAAAVAFRASGNLFLCGFFALAGCMAALTLARRAGTESDRFAAEHAYLFPPARYRFRVDWAAGLLLAAPFPMYYAACAVSLLGPSGALRAQSVWQMALTAFAFACLIVQDGFHHGRVEGRGEPAQAMLAAGYLGIAGVLFMFPGYGLLLAASAAVAAALPCLRAAGMHPARGGSASGRNLGDAHRAAGSRGPAG